MKLVESLSSSHFSKITNKLKSVLKVCPDEFLIFDHFFEQDDQDQISYTVGIPYEVFGYPLNIDKQFLPFIQADKRRENYFLLQRATQLLQGAAKENELSMIYFSDEGEESFEGFTSLLWSYHPGHHQRSENQLVLTRKISKLLLGAELENPPTKMFAMGELGHTGVAIRSERKIIKYYFRTNYHNAYQQVPLLFKELGLAEVNSFDFLQTSREKTIMFLDCEGPKVVRFGVEIRPDLIEHAISHPHSHPLPANIIDGLKEFSDITSKRMELSSSDERIRLHHLKLSAYENGLRWKAYYAYNIKN